MSGEAFVDFVDAVDRAIVAVRDTADPARYADLELAWLELLDALEKEWLL